ncbi:hypothetical protein ACHAXT_009233 [Thalassiosira profunda]
MAWGKGGSLRSCDALLKRVEDNDLRLTELVILPMKTFGAADAERLSAAIESGANTHLCSISASGHHLPPDSLRRFGAALSAQAKRAMQSGGEMGGIESLAIGSKDMGDEGIVALCEGLAESNGGLLEHVDFGWKNIGSKSLGAIGKTFASSKHLKHIDLSRNGDIGDEGMASVAKAAKENARDCGVAFPSLEKLVLAECNIGPAGMESLAELLSGPDNNRSKPIALGLGSNPIGADGCNSLAKLCAVPGKGSMISHLQISQSSIGDDGVGLLSKAALANPCTGLSVLDLSENSITKDGAKSLADSLAGSLPDLVELKVAKNDLGGEGVSSIMEVLASEGDGGRGVSTGKNATLQNLDLSHTKCEISGAKAVLTSRSIKTVRLFDNRLGSDGFRAIAPLLQGGHPSIENLDLGGNNADEDAVVALLNSIADKQDGQADSTLLVLEIGGNKFGDTAMEALTELKRVWPRLDVAHDKPVQQGAEGGLDQ